jgi:hypothetical protein
VTPDGFPLGYEVLPGNTADCTTLRDMLRKIEAQYGKANRVWVMDRGIPSEEVLAEMRAADPPVCYLGGTPRGGFPNWRSTSSGCPGRRCVRASTLFRLDRRAGRGPDTGVHKKARARGQPLGATEPLALSSHVQVAH